MVCLKSRRGARLVWPLSALEAHMTTWLPASLSGTMQPVRTAGSVRGASVTPTLFSSDRSSFLSLFIPPPSSSPLLNSHAECLRLYLDLVWRYRRRLLHTKYTPIRRKDPNNDHYVTTSVCPSKRCCRPNKNNHGLPSHSIKHSGFSKERDKEVKVSARCPSF